MVVRRAVALLATSTMVLLPGAAVAAPGECHVVDVEFQPASRTDLPGPINRPPQIVVWVEDAAGQYVETIFITNETGRRGLGNRPGRWDFNSGPLWPYGRRIATFPVWAGRHGQAFHTVVFQNGDDDNLSHPFNQSSRDLYYCRPMMNSEPAWSADTLTCASPNSVYTDKGMLDASRPSKYPPRSDITRAAGLDDISVETFASNPFDVVSQPTPIPDARAEVSWPIPETLPAGDYTMFVEVSKEFDHNATYSRDAYPAPSGIPWSEYGEPYRGQPSVVFRVPFTIGTTETVAQVSTIAGYGDPDGLDDNLRAPDATITADVPGSGVGRFALVSDGSGEFRVRVTARPEFDAAVPSAPAQMEVDDLTSSTATVTFIAPGDDGNIGKVTGYDIRYAVGGEPISEATFEAATKFDGSVPVGTAGELQSFEMARLLPETAYSVGIRAFDDCHNTGALTVISFVTPPRSIGEVDACFVATAAYGSVLAADVQMLRHLRDAVLKKSVLGELAVETYYTFGPAFAGVVGESELLRSTARQAITPLVRYARSFRL